MRVIAIDDEINALDAIQQELLKIPEIKKADFFDDPETALQFISENHVDVAFLDIEMGTTNGISLAKQIKEIKPETNIVFVTGYIDYALDAFRVAASDYLLKPTNHRAIIKALNQLRTPILKNDKRIRVETFGNFDLFVDNQLVTFKRAKSKELLAYLVDRRGASINKKELAAILFEDEYDRSKQSYLQTLVAELIKSLKNVDAEEILIKRYNGLAIDKTKFDCDCYRFLQGDMNAINEYTGEYMSQYSWAEFTLAALDEQKRKI